MRLRAAHYAGVGVVGVGVDDGDVGVTGVGDVGVGDVGVCEGVGDVGVTGVGDVGVGDVGVCEGVDGLEGVDGGTLPVVLIRFVGPPGVLVPNQENPTTMAMMATPMTKARTKRPTRAMSKKEARE